MGPVKSGSRDGGPGHAGLGSGAGSEARGSSPATTCLLRAPRGSAAELPAPSRPCGKVHNAPARPAREPRTWGGGDCRPRPQSSPLFRGAVAPPGGHRRSSLGLPDRLELDGLSFSLPSGSFELLGPRHPPLRLQQEAVRMRHGSLSRGFQRSSSPAAGPHSILPCGGLW
jgi:hypothetical protein